MQGRKDAFGRFWMLLLLLIHALLFPGEVRERPGFNGGEVADNEFVSGFRHKCRPNSRALQAVQVPKLDSELQ